MKKIILTAAALFSFGFANAQDGNFKVGLHSGLPVGDIKDFSSLNLGADLAYVWNLGDKFSAGVTTGYSNYLGKTFDLGEFGSFKSEDTGFIPVAATGQYLISDKLFLGADLGYAIFTESENSDGGFYYQPKFGYQAEKFEFYAAYKGISVDGGSFSSVNLGFNFIF
jgi:hypothetical protein